MGNVELHCTVEGAHCPETISQKKIIQYLKNLGVDQTFLY